MPPKPARPLVACEHRALQSVDGRRVSAVVVGSEFLSKRCGRGAPRSLLRACALRKEDEPTSLERRAEIDLRDRVGPMECPK